jgi:hypothetical protein
MASIVNLTVTRNPKVKNLELIEIGPLQAGKTKYSLGTQETLRGKKISGIAFADPTVTPLGKSGVNSSDAQTIGTFVTLDSGGKQKVRNLPFNNLGTIASIIELNPMTINFEKSFIEISDTSALATLVGANSNMAFCLIFIFED